MHGPQGQAAQGNQLLWVDAIKGLAIILVVIGHTWRGTAAAGLFDTAHPALYSAVESRIYAFHMPLFFMVSGFFLLSSLRRYDLAGFMTSRLGRLVWPMLLWSYIFLASKLVAGPLANDPISLSLDLLQPIPGKWQFWFLWALFLLHMVLLIIRPALLSDRFDRAALWGLLVLGFVLTWIRLPESVEYWTNNAAYFLQYLVAGMLISAYGLLRAQPMWAGGLGLVIAALLIALVPYVSQSPLPSALLAFAICLSLIAGLSWLGSILPSMTRGLAYFGQASMVIFLSHTLFSAPMRILLQKAGITDLSVQIISGVLIGLLGPLVLRYLITRTGKQALFGV